MKTAIYARVSTDDQSTVAQLDQCRNWCFNHNLQAEIYQDEGVSGVQVSRPALDRLLVDCRAGKVRTVVVFKLDRLGRSLRHVVNLLAEIQGYGVGVVATSQGIDTRESNPVGRLQVNMLLSFAEFEREMILDRVRTGVKSAQDRGVRFGRPAVEQTGEQRAAVEAHLAEHGLTRLRELGKKIGVNHSLAGRWLKAAHNKIHTAY